MGVAALLAILGNQAAFGTVTLKLATALWVELILFSRGGTMRKSPAHTLCIGRVRDRLRQFPSRSNSARPCDNHACHA